MPSDYLASMTRSEAFNYISSLPGLKREEYFALVAEAEKRPEHRHHMRDALAVKTRAYIEKLTDYLERKRGPVSRNQLVHDLKWNGSNLCHVLKTAQELEVIETVKRGTRSFYRLKSAKQ